MPPKVKFTNLIAKNVGDNPVLLLHIHFISDKLTAVVKLRFLIG